MTRNMSYANSGKEIWWTDRLLNMYGADPSEHKIRMPSQSVIRPLLQDANVIVSPNARMIDEWKVSSVYPDLVFGEVDKTSMCYPDRDTFIRYRYRIMYHRLRATA